MKENQISVYGWSLFAGVIMFLILSIASVTSSLVTASLVNKLTLETESIRRCEAQNERFWGFVSEIDSAESIDELVEKRDSLYDSLCEQ